MDSEAQTPAIARLERAIESLEAAVSHRSRADKAARAANSQDDAKHTDLSRRHEALKSAVAAALGDIDALLASGDRVDA